MKPISHLLEKDIGRSLDKITRRLKRYVKSIPVLDKEKSLKALSQVNKDIDYTKDFLGFYRRYASEEEIFKVETILTTLEYIRDHFEAEISRHDELSPRLEDVEIKLGIK